MIMRDMIRSAFRFGVQMLSEDDYVLGLRKDRRIKRRATQLRNMRAGSPADASKRSLQNTVRKPSAQIRTFIAPIELLYAAWAARPADPPARDVWDSVLSFPYGRPDSQCARS